MAIRYIAALIDGQAYIKSMKGWANHFGLNQTDFGSLYHLYKNEGLTDNQIINKLRG